MSAGTGRRGPGYRPNGGAGGDLGPSTDRQGPPPYRFSPPEVSPEDGQGLPDSGDRKWHIIEVMYVWVALDAIVYIEEKNVRIF